METIKTKLNEIIAILNTDLEKSEITPQEKGKKTAIKEALRRVEGLITAMFRD